MIYVGCSDKSLPPRLCENIPGWVNYTTLSHCWGSHSPLTTTAATLSARKMGIPLDTMPQTFRDAIRLTQYLEVEYLWIDSLCIVQDDDSDWTHEAERMGQIYGSSCLTIAAVSAQDATQGLFSDRNTSHEANIQSYPIFIRKAIDHLPFQKPLASSREVNKFPLLNRKWCFQECLLSQRIINYTADEMVWQCQSLDHCECGHLRTSTSTLRSRFTRVLKYQKPSFKYNPIWRDAVAPNIWTIWREITVQYSTRVLTRETDMLPAIAGVASEFAKAGAGRYVAG
ncbi:HET-domain-containing protein, partial [Tothia fuscella]